MYCATLKTKDGESLVGWMGREIRPQKKGYEAIRLQVVGAIAYIPDSEVEEIEMGEIVSESDLTILAPEKSEEIVCGVERPNQMYYKPTQLKSGSKLDQVVKLCKTNIGKTRKEMIEMIVERVGMTPAGASTYLNNAKSFLNGPKK